MKQRGYLITIYGYLIEFVLAALIYALVWKSGYIAQAINFVLESSAAWSTFFGVLLASAVAAWLVLFQFNADDFGAWLEWKGANSIYSFAFLFNVLLFALTTVLTLLLTFLKGPQLIVQVALYFIILGLINTFTLAKIVYQLTRLQAVFRLEFKKAVNTPSPE